jgi:PelA/Pel-15E family pectate lyase
MAGFSQKYSPFDPKPFQDSEHHWYSIFNKENIVNAVPNQPKYKPSQVIEIADNILLYQKNNGGWPKNYDMMAIMDEEQKKKLMEAKDETGTTFDNSTTYTHIASLSKIYTESGIEKYKTGCIKGLEFILAAQYNNGGWPQYYPLKKDYSRYITYNDDAMIGIMDLLKDIVEKDKNYAYIDSRLFGKLQKAYQKGIQCIIKTQINDNGKLTAWCQQYDESLAPAWARKFEPPSICNGESCGIVNFLMSIHNPSPEIVTAIKSAMTWFEESKILYTRVKTVEAPPTKFQFRNSHTDRVVVVDSAAPPIWTRYYELKTHRPLFCNRDSKVVYSLAEVERERRDGYGWYTYAPQSVLNKYPSYLKKLKKQGL